MIIYIFWGVVIALTIHFIIGILRINKFYDYRQDLINIHFRTKRIELARLYIWEWGAITQIPLKYGGIYSKLTVMGGSIISDMTPLEILRMTRPNTLYNPFKPFADFSTKFMLIADNLSTPTIPAPTKEMWDKVTPRLRQTIIDTLKAFGTNREFTKIRAFEHHLETIDLEKDVLELATEHEAVDEPSKMATDPLDASILDT